jgi:hypothetical protein
LVVALYRPGDVFERTGDPVLWLNTATVDPATCAHAIDRPDLVTWYEVINPVRVTTVGGGPVADDYSNVTITVPDGHRIVAHAVTADGTAPECLSPTAERILPSDDLWAVVRLGTNEVCQACKRRHG